MSVRYATAPRYDKSFCAFVFSHLNQFQSYTNTSKQDHVLTDAMTDVNNDSWSQSGLPSEGSRYGPGEGIGARLKLA